MTTTASSALEIKKKADPSISEEVVEVVYIKQLSEDSLEFKILMCGNEVTITHTRAELQSGELEAALQRTIDELCP